VVRPLGAGGPGRRIVLALLAAAALAGAYAWAVLRDLPDTLPLRDPSWVSRRFGLTAWTRLDDCSRPAVRAILLSEDDSFFAHHGLRLDELSHAAWDDLLTLRYKRGASSLTQQVVKNAFLGPEKTVTRKLREMVLARRADRLVGKSALLEDYLNLAEWGPNRERGIAFASRTYFGRPPGSLNARDGALLAWLLPDPRDRGRLLLRGELPGQAKRAVRRLLQRLVDEGSLDPQAALNLEQLPLPFERTGESTSPEPRER
jgi:monofunctional biosynthetic peptidoglycan transglycosylase